MAAVDFTPTLLLSVLLLLLSRTLAIPHSLFPRSQFCENVPAHKAGTPLSHRSSLDLRSSFPSDLDLVDAYPPSDLLPLSHLLARQPGRTPPPPPPPPPPTCAATAAHNCPGAHLWCAEDSNTWILSNLNLNSPANQQAVQNILARAVTQIRLHIHDTSDGPIGNGLYGYIQQPTGGGADTSTLPLARPPPARNGHPAPRPQPSTPHGLTLSAANANNHQMTWGVLGAAIQALLNLMWTQAWWGAALSTVFDGENEVGSLIVSTSVPGAAGQGPSAGGDPSISSGSSTENEESVSKPPGGHR